MVWPKFSLDVNLEPDDTKDGTTVMAKVLRLNPDRLFPANEQTRAIARRLYQSVAKLPILSPHGHTDPSWF
ncbi:hypothetical protein ACFQEU_17815, partial [Halorubrum tibetense]